MTAYKTPYVTVDLSAILYRQDCTDLAQGSVLLQICRALTQRNGISMKRTGMVKDSRQPSYVLPVPFVQSSKPLHSRDPGQANGEELNAGASRKQLLHIQLLGREAEKIILKMKISLGQGVTMQINKRNHITFCCSDS
jgi:hypothetical protein